ncbi:MAG: methenyltetrahydromethanopterin cyclohydrolase, partial [Deltaproteobacteria bacterium]
FSSMISLNDRALAIVRQMITDAEALELKATQLGNGATLLDAGVNVSGSLEAGRLFAEACLGGMAKVHFCEISYGEISFPGVDVAVSQPALACMGAQYAGWAVRVSETDASGSYMAMGSGPARALFRGEPLFQELEYRDPTDVAVLALESRSLPSERVAEWIAEKCHVSPARLYLLVAPTASLVGSVQVSARVVETGLHKMLEVGFDISTVLSGFGTCPVAFVGRDDLHAIGRTNDAVLYGGRAWYTVRGDDPQIESVIERLPSSASKDYGISFYELLKQYGGDFYKVDPLLFSPAEVFINNVSSGRAFHAGSVSGDLITRMLLE